MQSLDMIPGSIRQLLRSFIKTEAAVDATANVQTKAGQYGTSAPRIFTAGDMHRGQSLVVWAIHEGREAARAVDASLMGYSNL